MKIIHSLNAQNECRKEPLYYKFGMANIRDFMDKSNSVVENLENLGQIENLPGFLHGGINFLEFFCYKMKRNTDVATLLRSQLSIQQ